MSVGGALRSAAGLQPQLRVWEQLDAQFDNRSAPLNYVDTIRPYAVSYDTFTSEEIDNWVYQAHGTSLEESFDYGQPQNLYAARQAFLEQCVANHLQSLDATHTAVVLCGDVVLACDLDATELVRAKESSAVVFADDKG